jgi:AAHS family 3-hydroxyphenylpropionic acid transporter
MLVSASIPLIVIAAVAALTVVGAFAQQRTGGPQRV